MKRCISTKALSKEDRRKKICDPAASSNRTSPETSAETVATTGTTTTAAATDIKSPLLTRVLDQNDTAAALSRIFLGDGFFRAEATKSGREHKIVLFPLAKDENESLVDAHGDKDAWSQPTAKRRKGVRSAGKIIFTQRTANSGTIDHVWVRETHRGLGFGSILL